MKSVQYVVAGILIVVLSQVLMSAAQGQGSHGGSDGQPGAPGGNGGSAGQPGAPGGNGGNAGQPGAPGGSGYAGANGSSGGYQHSSASSTYASAWSTIYVVCMFLMVFNNGF